MSLFGFTLVRVTGRSMEPNLPEGSFALFQRRKAYSLGDTVLAHHPVLGRIVKDIAGEAPSGFLLRGTSPLSTSTETIGTVTHEMIMGKKIWQTAPEKEAQPI